MIIHERRRFGPRQDTQAPFRSHGLLSLWAVLLVVWMVANSTLAVVVVLLGAAITLPIAWILASSGGTWNRIRWTPDGLLHFSLYGATFLVELVKANIAMMRYVYAPRIDIKPGIVKVRTRLKIADRPAGPCQYDCADAGLARDGVEGRHALHPPARYRRHRRRRDDRCNRHPLRKAFGARLWLKPSFSSRLSLSSAPSCLAVTRLVLGPTLIDRIVAIDMLTIISISLIVLYAHVSGRFVYIDVALVYGLLSFLAVLAIARFLEKGL